MPGYNLKTPRPPASYGDRGELHRKMIRDALAEVLDLIEAGSIGNLIYANTALLSTSSNVTTISAPGVTVDSAVFAIGLSTPTGNGHGPMLASNSQFGVDAPMPPVTVGTVIPFDAARYGARYGTATAWTLDLGTNQFIAQFAGTTHFQGQVGGFDTVAGPVDLMWEKVSGAGASPFSPLGLFGGRGTLDATLAVAPIASGVSTHYIGDRYRMVGVASVFGGGPGTYTVDEDTVSAVLDTTPLGLSPGVTSHKHGLTAEAGTDQILVYHAATSIINRSVIVAAFDKKV